MYSRFYNCDLQVHTVADQGQKYGDWASREPSRAFAEELIRHHAERGVEVLGVSDHNRVDWYPELRAAGDASVPPVWVFPATEVSVNGCHLLLIWDRTEQGYELARHFLVTLFPPPDGPFEASGDPRVITKQGVIEVARDAIVAGALVLAPHATMSGMGLFASRVCRNKSEVAKSGLVLGFDVIGDKKRDVLSNPRSEFGESLTPAWFMSGDTRDFASVGTRSCHLKLGAEPTLEGLRQAFLMPHTRIRFKSDSRSDWVHVKHVRFMPEEPPVRSHVDRLTVVGGFHDGVDLEFGPGLNAVIGGKGTGKSALIEILRYGLSSDNRHLEDALRRNREANLPANAEVQISFVGNDETRYAVSRPGGGQPASKLRADSRDTDLRTEQRFRAQIFGQDQLRHLVHSEHLRKHVEGLAETAVAENQKQERETLSQIGDLNARLSALESSLTRQEELADEYADLSEQIRQAKESGAEEGMAELKRLASQRQGILKTETWLAEFEDALQPLQEHAANPLASDDDLPELAEFLRPVLTAMSEGLQRIRESARTAAERVSHLREDRDPKLAARAADIRQSLQDIGFENAKQLGEAQQRLAELGASPPAPEAIRSEIRSLDEKRVELVGKLWEHRRARSRALTSAIESLNSEIGPRVRITQAPIADRSELVDQLRDLAPGSQKQALERSVRAHLPLDVSSAIRHAMSGQSQLEDFGFTPTTASKLVGCSDAELRDLDLVDVPDLLTLELDVATREDGPTWKSVDDVSPGQQATALLALVLASGTEPLIIDQPEEDLDNRYIFDEVVTLLADVSERRQVIVATHNANIPVLGDAELVVAFDASASKSSLLACGGLEGPDVAGWTREILEGGEQAFERRLSRYPRGA